MMSNCITTGRGTRLGLAAFVLFATSTLALADMVTAEVESWDPETKQLVLNSGEVFEVDIAKTPLPEGMEMGDKITIDYQSNDNGVTAIYEIKMAE